MTRSCTTLPQAVRIRRPTKKDVLSVHGTWANPTKKTLFIAERAPKRSKKHSLHILKLPYRLSTASVLAPRAVCPPAAMGSFSSLSTYAPPLAPGPRVPPRACLQAHTAGQLSHALQVTLNSNRRGSVGHRARLRGASWASAFS